MAKINVVVVVVRRVSVLDKLLDKTFRETLTEMKTNHRRPVSPRPVARGSTRGVRARHVSQGEERYS